MNLPVVAIVGRPNVGKSSLFNRFLRRNLAVVDEQPGVTRDRNYAVCDWAGSQFYLIDTGGIVPQSKDLMEKAITDQTDFAINESDVVVFLVDARVGADPTDLRIARDLNRAGKNCLLVANKSDSEQAETEVYDFLKLGLGEAMPVSATVGRNIGELLDAIVARLPSPEAAQAEAEDSVRVALVGRPNVGKSSFINKLINQQRLLVTPVAGTTRDSVDTPFEFEGKKYVLIDTAGLRRKYKVHENIEFYTNLRTDRAIDGCDVAVVMLDATQGTAGQDLRILDKVASVRRPAILAVNKWDLVEKDTKTADDFTRELKAAIARHAHVPVVYISALTGQRVTKVMSMVSKVDEENRRRIETAELNRFLKTAVSRKHPPARKGKYIKLNYVTQSETAPPTFVFFCNYPELVDKSYISYLSNRLRAEFGFEGVPIRLKFRKK
ncbi:MAG: ribosome biogenesis GTPase Der [Candidatus Zixiibacteriota bacterium]|nr:MAG: ribosome biogenesis GTPase Der [candidate division Zixibacteria bacterium]